LFVNVVSDSTRSIHHRVYLENVHLSGVVAIAILTFVFILDRYILKEEICYEKRR
jgi:hypothetical protein